MPVELSSVLADEPALPGINSAGLDLGDSPALTVNAGLVAFSIPLALPVARESRPSLSLNYASTGGNGFCGIGWALSLSGIQRQTRLGVPDYTDNDTFVGPDGEPLVPKLDAAGGIVSKTGVTTCLGATLPLAYTVTDYASRTPVSPVRFQYWRNDSNVFWLAFEPDGVIHCFGYTASARVADPAAASRVARWLLEESLFPNGEHVLVRYKAEDAVNVSDGRAGTAQRYPDRIDYANLVASDTPYLFAAALPVDSEWLRTLKFDYGQWPTADRPPPDWTAPGTWAVRPDPFSDYSFGFELRSYRLCRQLLVFCRAPASPSTPKLHGCLSFGYDSTTYASRLISLRRRAYEADNSLLYLPSTLFSWSAGTPAVDSGWQSLADWPQTPGYQLVDLYGDGLPGLLYRQNNAWLYRAPQRTIGKTRDAVSYGKATPLPRAPIASARGRQMLQDINGDGRLDWIHVGQGQAGFFTLNDDHSWSPFVPFSSFPVEFLKSGAQLANLIGDGRLDVVMTGPHGVRVYKNNGTGFDMPVTIAHQGGDLPVFGQNAQELVAFANLLGGSTPQLVRIRVDSVSCWPDLGRGAFGNEQHFSLEAFDSAAAFDPKRLFVVDLDGSGTADLLYARPDGLRLYRNRAGNGFDSPETLAWPDGFLYDDTAGLNFGDVAGLGVPSLLLSQRHGEPKHWRHDFLSGPANLLVGVDNQRGRDIRLGYRSSAQYRLDDWQIAPGSPSHLPMALSLCSEVVDRDAVQGHADSYRYVYHGGMYDPVQRRLNGFRRVDRIESSDALDGYSQPLYEPVLTRSWFHTGQKGDDVLRDDYYAGDPPACKLKETYVTFWDGSMDTVRTDAPDAWYQALRGLPLHEEVYPGETAEDGAVPMRVSSTRWQLRVLQENKETFDAVIAPLTLEMLDVDYDSSGLDPRTRQQVILSRDGDSNPTRQVQAFYPRRPQDANFSDPQLSKEQLAATYDDSQQRLRLHECTRTWIRRGDDSHWRLGLVTGEVEQALDYPASEAANGLSFESLSDPAGLLKPDAPRTLRHWWTQSYLGDENRLPQTVGRVTGRQQAQLDDASAHAAYDPVLGATNVSAQLLAAGYLEGSLNGQSYWLAEQQQASYAEPAGFYRLQTLQANAKTGLQTFGYEPAGSCWLTSVRNALNQKVATTSEPYGWRPVSMVDMNGKRHEVCHDALGRLIAVSNSNFDPVSDYVPARLSPEEASASPETALQGMAAVAVYAAGSWTDGKKLPAHYLVLEADRAKSAGTQQIRQRMAYSDGHGRLWRDLLRVEAGEAYLLDEEGHFILDNDEPILGPAETRWAVAAGDERRASGGPLRHYSAYFVNRGRPAQEAPPLPYAVHYEGGGGRSVLDEHGNGTVRQRRTEPWYAVEWDENDSYWTKPVVEPEPGPDPEPESDIDPGSSPGPEPESGPESESGPAVQLVVAKRTETYRPPIGANGERITWIGQRDQLYALGNGARNYAPSCERFLTMDNLSPFGVGGINPYAYCGGDPVNRSDPSGHLSTDDEYDIFMQVFAILLTVAGVIMAIPTGGWTLGLVAVAGTVFIASRATLIASIAIAGSDPKISSELKTATFALETISTLLLMPTMGKDFKAGVKHIKSGFYGSRKADPSLTTSGVYFNSRTPAQRRAIFAHGVQTNPRRAAFAARPDVFKKRVRESVGAGLKNNPVSGNLLISLKNQFNLP